MRPSRASRAYVGAQQAKRQIVPLGVRAQVATPVAVTAPTRGWNTRDSLDSMDPTDSIVMDNWFPGLGSIYVRPGYTMFATSLGGSVKMLAEFNAGTSRKLIAGANGNIWDISAGGAGVSLASGFGSDAWQWAQFDDASGGARMGLVNGSDAPQNYNGTAVTPMTISGTGLTASTLDGVHIFKSRSYFWSTQTQDFWYSATNALGGVLTKFPLGRVQGTGGNIVGMGTWSRDAGDGMDDLAVFVLSSGDVLVYAGDNPGSATDWQLVGRYAIGAAISIRGIRKFGSELVIITKAGYVALTKVLQSGVVNEQKSAFSDRIRGAALDSVHAYGSNFGWEIMHYPRRNWLLVNVPLSPTQCYQHVMNTETGAWCRFKGIDALCWGMYQDSLYFGTNDGNVWLMDSGYGDNGQSILFDCQTAWNYLGDRRVKKRVTSARLLMRTTGGTITYGLGIGFDFRDFQVSATQNAPVFSGSAWDTSPWDTTPWAEEFIQANIWSSLRGDGYCMSSRVRGTTNSQRLDWFAINYLIEKGGVI